MRYAIDGPAMHRLEWLLDGLAGQPGWGEDAAEVLAPAFTAHIPPDFIVERIRQRALTYAPLTILALEARDQTARARLRRHSDSAAGPTTDVLTCVVEPEAPHRIIATHTIGLVPEYTAPRLPTDFANYSLPPVPGALPAPPAPKARLIVISGVPGVGKSTLADAVGSRLGIPVFATDWLLGALTPFGGRHLDDLLEIGAELLTTLAVRQLTLGQSAILDHPTEAPVDRNRWRSLAHHAKAEFVPVHCVCPDPTIHRARLEGRIRAIPGWHNAGAWSNVERRTAAFPPWPDDTLIVDTTAPHDESLAAVLARLGA
jgi:hypothetical protein